jgi:hypothetical protein
MSCPHLLTLLPIRRTMVFYRGPPDITRRLKDISSDHSHTVPATGDGELLFSLLYGMLHTLQVPLLPPGTSSASNRCH